MSDRMAVVVALAAAAGAWIERGASPWIGAALVLAALVSRWPLALAVAVFLFAGGLAARAEAGLVHPTSGSFSGTVTLLSDPEPAPSGAGADAGGVRADVRLASGQHLEATAGAVTAGSLRGRAAGERVTVTGRILRSPPGRDWLRVRHVSGRLAIDEISAWSGGGWTARAANTVRATVQRGASALPERQRPLFLGFVLGDTRGQAADLTDDFRGSGLTHLLAVSGENVAFVLALAGPLLRRLSLGPRFVTTIAVIAFFALVTRFEPSVLRASVMAALAVTATTLGRDASRLRLLALAVAALLLVDPFLVRAVGFQLSVAACAGIVVLAPRLARVIPGPRVLTDALAVTIAAQAGVAPVLVVVFGGVPLASVPANVLVAPVAAAVMVWGVGAGMLAGLLGPGAAAVLHWPTSVMIAWIAGVARWGATMPLGELRARHLAVLTLGIIVVAVGRRRHASGFATPVLRTGGCALIAVAFVMPMVALRSPPDGPVGLGSGAVLWRSGDGSLLELDGRAHTADVLEGLRRAGVRGLGVVVVRTTSSSTAASIETLRRWGTVGHVLAPPGSAVAGATPVTEVVELDVGALRATVTPDLDRLVVDIARGPPV